eukprot:COSAG02_NODE_3580_length_6533_cov_1.657600_3_plen_108_part_00
MGSAYSLSRVNGDHDPNAVLPGYVGLAHRPRGRRAARGAWWQARGSSADRRNGKRSRTEGYDAPVTGGYGKHKHTLVAKLPGGEDAEDAARVAPTQSSPKTSRTCRL